ncbi:MULTISPECIES: guanylate kinase [Nonlabens]|uniref:Guanylate kinase n=1 Tax=Nonlabens ulvanivorans TaxID=906888 RepID=A0A081D7W9_NONUL|nr:guanylate kinase [Nonlabens ulvanivorans]KEZ92256.1 guanylate kinase [Nonlabens ulvanivorans]PRX15087.1 guanylate kinase [Nonlabens ulvanivorans]WOI22560.1 guanylate kinase [Nonlabens ulvanivorans]GAK75015.1 guanylate kinase [Nonlabens ulvanivorans]GAK98893.1 guanylate kinase [Nonlabens ulvanivorans]
MTAQPKLIVFSAPSGAGKTTLVRHLLKIEDLNLAFSISAASREAREGEIDGIHYYFLGIPEFKNRIRANDFIEFEEVYKDQFYGTLKSEVERLWAQGKNVIFDIDVVGGLRLKNKFPDRCISIFVKPPSINELQKRLKNRKTESEEKIAMRVAKASTEMATAPQFDVIIKNDDLELAKQQAEDIVRNFIHKKVGPDEEE